MSNHDHRLRPSAVRAEWGVPMPLLHRSIADLHEKELVQRVLTDPANRSTMFNIEGMATPESRILREVDLRPLGARGDIDVLVIPPAGAKQATAVQVKRFKVGLDAIRTGQPNGLKEFTKGVRQANLLARLGFGHVYLWVFVVIDTREQNAGRLTYDGADAAMRSKIDNAVFTGKLDPRIGVMKFEWTQPMDRAPLTFGTSGASLHRLAIQAPQSGDVTAWLNKF